MNMFRPQFLAISLLASFSTAAFAGAEASSFKKETRNRGTNYWNAQSAIDGDLSTAWMVSGESENKGEYIILDLPKSTVDKLGMVVGFAKNEDTFKDFARVKDVKVSIMSYNETNELVPAGSTTASFADEMGMQVIDLEDLPVGSDMFGGKITITVDSIYEGLDYPNFAVSEVLIHLAEFEAAPTILAISSESGGHVRESLVDDNSRSFWAGDVEGGSITFEASGFSLSKVGIQGAGTDYGRVKKVQISANGRVHVQEIENSKDVQWVMIPAVTGYTGSAWGEIQLDILEVYPGSKYPDQVGIAELDLMATAFEGL